MPKLNQILAIEKSVKNRTETKFTKIYQDIKKVDLLTGLSKTYQPKKDDDEEKFPPESKKVQVKSEDLIKQLKTNLIELLNIEATMSASNCTAKSDVVVDGQTLLKDIPVTHLLFLKDRLTQLTTFAKDLVPLDSAETYKFDENSGLHYTDPVETIKTKKIEEFVTIVPPTKEHPAQVGKTTKDVIQGTWKTVKFSGALPVDRIEGWSERVEKLSKAVSFAIEHANHVEAVELKTGEAVMGYVDRGTLPQQK